jgi:pyruvate dehydrogenase E2 component (dihydrolipoyllysine-residue acetyltransferase)
VSSSTSNGKPVADQPLAPVPEGVELTVPDLGPSVDAATIVAWAKHVGDRVAADEPICRLAVNELQFEVHSTAEGELRRVFAEAGETVHSDDSLAEIGAQMAEREPAAAEEALAPPPEPEPPPIDVEPGSPALEIGPDPTTSEVESEPPDAELEPEPAPEQPEPDIDEDPPFYVTEPPATDPDADTLPEPTARTEPAPEREAEPDIPLEAEEVAAVQAEPLAAGEVEDSPAQPDPDAWPPPSDVDWSRWHSPVVRMLAEQNDIDLSQIAGTGIDGRIRKRDLLAQIEDAGHA